MLSTPHRTALLFLMFLFFAFTQKAIGQQDLSIVPLEMRDRPWLDNVPHTIWGHSVTLLSGQKFSRYKNMNVGEFTTVAYQSLDQILDSLNKQAEKDQWDEEKIMEETRYYTENAPGGRLMFFISRYEQSVANTRWYFVILRDADDQNILEEKLQYQAPQNPEGLGWWNWYEFLIKKNIDLPFYVYLNYNVSDHLTDFRFYVKPLERKLEN